MSPVFAHLMADGLTFSTRRSLAGAREGRSFRSACSCSVLTPLPCTAFVSNGGIATDNLLDPKLTHLVVYNTVRDRFKELIRKTME